ncbi:MAG: hypothetical protein QNK40_09240 [Desulfobacterales bacterium]|nr:hypothetical protein [Desulfobacterales bacterium]MDX2509329.1 hypothetical protein [Desulfobacterales bacterium]
MDSYLIRIYRREKGKPENIVGIIEEIGAKEKHSFKNLSELGKIICPIIQKSPRKKQTKSSKKKKKEN